MTAGSVVDIVVCVALFLVVCIMFFFFFFQAEDGIRDLVRSRGLGDVYKRQVLNKPTVPEHSKIAPDQF